MRNPSIYIWTSPLQWHHNERDCVSNPQPHDCLLNCLFRRRSQETTKLRVTGICEGNSPVTGEFPSQRASDAENVSIWWRHHVVIWPATPARWRPSVSYPTDSPMTTRLRLCDSLDQNCTNRPSSRYFWMLVTFHSQRTELREYVRVLIHMWI